MTERRGAACAGVRTVGGGTSASRRWTRRLKSADLPTLGRPTIATCTILSCHILYCASRTQKFNQAFSASDAVVGMEEHLRESRLER